MAPPPEPSPASGGACPEGRVEIVLFQDRHAPAFRALNLAWIERDFGVEEPDRRQLWHPRESILEPGGQIFIAEFDARVVGTCALLREDAETYELIKMGVDESVQGRGIGRSLLDAAVHWARRRGARRITLISASSLEAALHLYESYGFSRRPFEPAKTEYARCDVAMELSVA